MNEKREQVWQCFECEDSFGVLNIKPMILKKKVGGPCARFMCIGCSTLPYILDWYDDDEWNN